VLSTILEIISKAVAWIFARPALRVRIREDLADRDVGGLIFEVENVSNKSTSLSPTVTARYLSIKRVPSTVVFDVREGDRNLAPFTPRQLTASAREAQPQRHHAWFRTYTFVPTRGRNCRVRIRNASLEPIGIWRFWIESLWFRATGRVVVGKTSMTMAEFNAQERSRGPH